MILNKAFTVLAASATVISACSCKTLTPNEALQTYTTVFSGEIANVQYVDRPEDVSPRIVVHVTVLDMWKGTPTARVVLHTHRRDGHCEGLPASMLRVGERLLVYAIKISSTEWKEPGTLTTDICSRTRILRKAKEDLTALGPPF